MLGTKKAIACVLKCLVIASRFSDGVSPAVPFGALTGEEWGRLVGHVSSRLVEGSTRVPVSWRKPTVFVGLIFDAWLGLSRGFWVGL